MFFCSEVKTKAYISLLQFELHFIVLYLQVMYSAMQKYLLFSSVLLNCGHNSFIKTIKIKIQ